MKENDGAGKLTKRNLWAFSIATFGRDIANTMFSGYLLTFILFTKNLNAAQFAAINIIMVAARIFDGFNDPIMGAIVDMTRTRWGKFKPWIFIGMLSTSAIIYTMFSNSLQGWGFVVLVGVLYFLYSICFTMNDIAYWGMIPSLARSTDDRNLLTSRTTLFAGAGGALVGVLLPMFTAGAGAIGGNAVTAYHVLAIVFTLTFIALQSVTLVGVKEKPQPPRDPNAPKFSFKRIAKVILGNDQLLWAALILLMYSMSLGMDVLKSTYVYFTFGYNGTLMLLFSGIGYVISGLAILFFARLARRFSRRRLMLAAAALSMVGYLGMFLVGALVPGGGTGKFATLAALSTFAVLGPQFVYLISMLCISNSIEYSEWKNGTREEGIIASVRPFITKVGTALGQLFVTVAYLVVGVTVFTNQISSLENQAARGLVTEAAKTAGIEEVIASVPAGSSIALLACMTLIPMAFVIIAYLAFRFKYKITEEKYEEIIREIDERGAAAAG